MPDPTFTVERKLTANRRNSFLLLLGALLLTTACATAPAGPFPPSAGPASFQFGPDTFAFRNEIRERHPEEEGMYANYCFVLARGVRQFFQYARFDPEAPRLTSAEYARIVAALAAHKPWEPALPPAQRIVIPGYPHLRAFSAAEEAAVKEGLGSPVASWFHWTNWRVTRPVSKAHQAEIAEEITSELAQGRLVQLLVTNWPIVELNHTVIAYAYVDRADHVDFTIWDPNEIDTPGVITFDRVAQRFWATQMFAVRPGVIRAFRMYHTPGL
jgi:hypothetical protein